MGAFCSGCSKRGKRRVGVEDLPPHLRSKEILDELRAIGVITAATSGGMTFDIQPDGRIKASVPRRLPALLGQNRAHGGQGSLIDSYSLYCQSKQVNLNNGFIYYPMF